MRNKDKSFENSKEEIKYCLENWGIKTYIDIYFYCKRKLEAILNDEQNIAESDIDFYAKDLYNILSKIIINTYKVKSYKRSLRTGTWNYLSSMEEELLQDFFILSKQLHNKCTNLQTYGENIIKLRNRIYFHDVVLTTINIEPDINLTNVEIEKVWTSYLIGNEKLDNLIDLTMHKYASREYIEKIINDTKYMNDIVKKYEIG